MPLVTQGRPTDPETHAGAMHILIITVGGPAHSFPLFFSGVPLFPFFFVLAGIANTQKQTDDEQREALFLPR